MHDEEKQKNYEVAERLFSEQNFSAAVVVGAVATIIASVAYGMIVAIWPFAYGFAAAGVGIVIGSAMGFLGRGISMKFAVAAALYTLLGCILSNLCRVVISQMRALGASPIDVFRDNSFSALAEQALSNIVSIVLLYWFVAIVAAVFLSKRPLSRSDKLAIRLYESRS